MSEAARVLAADPPWRFRDKLPGKNRGAERNYGTLSIQDLVRFPLPPIAPDAWLFLWRVSSQIEDAYQVLWAWGFREKTEIVWRKLTKTGKPWFGMGRYLRATHETCIVATRGRVAPLNRGIRSMFEAPVPVDSSGCYLHSAKPEIFYTEIIPALTSGPYVELFARTRRPGWTQHGDQLA